MQDYRHKTKIKLDWSGLDYFRHINNLETLRFVQTARVEYLMKAGIMEDLETIAPILASVSCDYLKPIYFPGHVTVYSKIDAIRNTSFKMSHEIYNDDGELVARASDVFVMTDAKNGGKKTRIPDELRVLLLSVSPDS